MTDDTQQTMFFERVAEHNRNEINEYAPVASYSTGLMFQGALGSKVENENDIRIRGTSYKGRLQFDTENDGAPALARHFHPLSENKDSSWYNDEKKDLPFRGWPNPDLFVLNTGAINSRNMGNLTQLQLNDALAAYDPLRWDEMIGKQHDASRTDAAPYEEPPVPSDGRGISADPEKINDAMATYEVDYAHMKRVQTIASGDRFGPSAEFDAEQVRLADMQQKWFDQIATSKSIYSRS